MGFSGNDVYGPDFAAKCAPALENELRLAVEGGEPVGTAKRFILRLRPISTVDLRQGRA